MATTLADRNILCNVVACGMFPTKMTKQTLDSFGDVILNQIPLKRYGTEQDIGGLIVFLSSKASSWMTGVEIPLDGGTVANSKI